MDEPLFIKDWAKVFWLAEAEKAKEIWWTRFPVARNGNSYRRLMASRDGHTAFAVFIGILRLCQRERTHGRVLVKGKPVTPLDVAAETGISVRLVKAGIDLLKSDDVAWLIPMSKVTPDMRLDGEQPGDNRATTGQQPASNRASIGVKPLSEKRREEEEKNNSSNSILSLGATGADKAPIAAAAELSVAKVQERAVAIATKPGWVPEDKPWITEAKAKALAALPFKGDVFKRVLREAKASRKTLANPAGYVIRRLEEAAAGRGTA
jgi:hypothetical protein